ncbi:DUF4432 family protein [Actinomyces sp. F1_1611]
MNGQVSLQVCSEDFSGVERQLASAADISVSSFRYPSGVEALRVQVGRVEAIILPFRGQQIWRYLVDGRDLTMHTHFDQPTASVDFAQSYGAFLLHCGLTGVGAPGPGDTHLHHGELPMAACGPLTLTFGGEAGENWLEVTSPFRYRVTHSYDYEVELQLRFDVTTPIVSSRVTITNHRQTALEFSYLCHLNWTMDQPLQLHQMVPDRGIEWAPHPGQDGATAALLERYAQDPKAANEVSSRVHISPEYCAVLTPTPGPDGVAEFLAVRPDGSAFWVAFHTDELPRAVRWISNTVDERAAGFCLPSTGHHFGRAQNEADGLLRSLSPGETTAIEVRFGLLDRTDAWESEVRIASVLMGQTEPK